MCSAPLFLILWCVQTSCCSCLVHWPDFSPVFSMHTWSYLSFSSPSHSISLCFLPCVTSKFSSSALCTYLPLYFISHPQLSCSPMLSFWYNVFRYSGKYLPKLWLRFLYCAGIQFSPPTDFVHLSSFSSYPPCLSYFSSCCCVQAGFPSTTMSSIQLSLLRRSHVTADKSLMLFLIIWASVYTIFSSLFSSFSAGPGPFPNLSCLT